MKTKRETNLAQDKPIFWRKENQKMTPQRF